MVSYFLLGYFFYPMSYWRRKQKNTFMLLYLKKTRIATHELFFSPKAFTEDFTGNNMLYSCINNSPCLQQSIKQSLYFLPLSSTPSPPILQPAWQDILYTHIHTSHLYLFMMTLTTSPVIPILKQQQWCKISPVKDIEKSVMRCRSYPFIF